MCRRHGPYSGKRASYGPNLCGWKLLRGDSALMARILGHGSEFWPRIHQYMLWDSTQNSSSEFGMVHGTPARNLGMVHNRPVPMGWYMEPQPETWTAPMGCLRVYQHMMGCLRIYQYIPWNSTHSYDCRLNVWVSDNERKLALAQDKRVHLGIRSLLSAGTVAEAADDV